MRIVIDGRMMGPRWTGIGLYTQKLVENLAAIDHDNDYLILVDQDNFDRWTPPAANISKVLAPQKIYSLAEQLVLPFRIWRLKPDLVHFLHNVPVIYRGRRVVMIHDTTMVDFDLAPAGLIPGLKYRLKRLAMRLVFRASASATNIIVPSQATKDRLMTLLKVPASRIKVIYEAAGSSRARQRALDLKHPKLLYVGTLFPYKNLSVVLEAMPALIQEHPELKLTVIGSTPRFNQSVKDQVDQLGLSKNVELAGFVSDEAKTQAFMTQAVLSLSDVQAYPVPLTFVLKDFTQVQASVFQVARAPGKTVVYLGCALLILGVFAMLYVRERRVWIWVRPESTGTRATMALSSNRKTMDGDREFEHLKIKLLSLAPASPDAADGPVAPN